MSELTAAEKLAEIIHAEACGWLSPYGAKSTAEAIMAAGWVSSEQAATLVAAALLEVPDAWLAYSSAEDGDAGDDFEHWIKARAGEIKGGGAA